MQQSVDMIPRHPGQVMQGLGCSCLLFLLQEGIDVCDVGLSVHRVSCQLSQLRAKKVWPKSGFQALHESLHQIKCQTERVFQLLDAGRNIC